MPRVVNLSPITELIAIFVRSLRKFVIKRDRINAKLWKGMKLPWFGDAVVVRVLPQSQAGEDRITAIDNAVAVTTFRGP